MIGEEIKKTVFRDTNSFYTTMPVSATARQLMRFVKKFAGNKILDLGCATGNYSLALKKMGYDVKGADVNSNYVNIAQERGVDAVLITDKVPFPDKFFDTVICFEVIEHVLDIDQLLLEAKRIARKNVLLTTPNSEHVEELMKQGLLFEHFAELDHKNFFTQKTLLQVLNKHFPYVVVQRGDGINPFALFKFSSLRFFGKVLTRLNIIHPKFYFRLFAYCEV